MFGDIAENDHTASQYSIIANRPARDRDHHRLRIPGISHKQLHLIARLAANRLGQRDFIDRIQSLPVGIEQPIAIGPLFGRRIGRSQTDELLGGRVEHDEFALRVGHDHALADVVEDAPQNLSLFAQRGVRLGQLLALLSQQPFGSPAFADIDERDDGTPNDISVAEGMR